MLGYNKDGDTLVGQTAGNLNHVLNKRRFATLWGKTTSVKHNIDVLHHKVHSWGSCQYTSAHLQPRQTSSDIILHLPVTQIQYLSTVRQQRACLSVCV